MPTAIASRRSSKLGDRRHTFLGEVRVENSGGRYGKGDGTRNLRRVAQSWIGSRPTLDAFSCFLPRVIPISRRPSICPRARRLPSTALLPLLPWSFLHEVFALFPFRSLLVGGVRGLASAWRVCPGASCAHRGDGNLGYSGSLRPGSCLESPSPLRPFHPGGLHRILFRMIFGRECGHQSL
jgi:hypothetical protein